MDKYRSYGRYRRNASEIRGRLLVESLQTYVDTTLTMITTVANSPEPAHCIVDPGRLTLSELKILDNGARSLSSLPTPRHAHPLQHALEVSFRSCLALRFLLQRHQSVLNKSL